MSVLTEIALPEKLSNRLQALASDTGTSKKDLIIEAIAQHLDQQTELEIEEKILDRINGGESMAYTLDSIKDDLPN